MLATITGKLLRLSPGLTGPVLFNRDSDRSSVAFRIPLAIAIISVMFERWIEGESNLSRLGEGDVGAALKIGLLLLSAVLCTFSRSSRLGIAVFVVVAAIEIAPGWMGNANHTWLALWTIPMAVIFAEWWRSDLYALYLRITLGAVMIAAFAQKVLAGTYVDGTYIYWLSIHGGETERLFSFACDMTTGVPCLAHKFIGQFILVWQLAVGILLLLGVKSLLFLTIEVGFLLGAGLYADEMNFQVLNIALLCVIFKVGMPNWLIVCCCLLLLIDVFTISQIYLFVGQYVF